jgi:hypothetical protein
MDRKPCLTGPASSLKTGRAVLVIEPRGIAMIKTAIPLSIHLFEYAGLAVAIALSGAIFIPKTKDQRKHGKPLVL